MHHCPECGEPCDCGYLASQDPFADCEHECDPDAFDDPEDYTAPDECRPNAGIGPMPGDKPGWGAEYREIDR
jgi:hypothetical protein